MIKANELRIGNIINGVYQLEEDNDMHYTLCRFLGYHPFDNYIYVESKDGIEEFIQFQPVILNEEILLKCGFVQGAIKYIYHYVVADWYHIAKIDDCFVFRGLGASIVKVETLHNLQNLIFSLTGQELNTSGL